MEKKIRKVIELEILDDLENSGVEAIALVDSPAIEKNWLYFRKEKFVEPESGESQSDYMSRCVPYQMDEGKPQDQAVAICISTYENFEFNVELESYNDYPKAAVENAKIALRWAEENGWSDCGTPVGKARANQLANGESLSRDTIARMASFERHRQNSTRELGDGCGRLMWLAWGGDEGIEWAQRKLKEIDIEMGIDTSGLAPYTQQTPKKKSDLIEESVNFSAILEKAKTLGFSSEDLLSNGLEFHSEDTFDIKLAKGYTVYKYSGSIGGNSRDFCRQMMNLDRFYSFEDIASMGSRAVNPGFGENGSDTYSIWKYKGGPNCKHSWRKFYVTEFGAIQNKGLAPGTAGEKPIDMPNQGYVNPPWERFHAFADVMKKELVGAVAIPNMEIPRKDEDGDIYFVKFSEDLVKRMSEKFFKEGKTNSTNIQHVSEDNAGTYITQSWIVEDPATDKANTIYNLDVPKGTWMVAAKVTDDKTWEKVKAGDLKGFSLEGSFVSVEEYEDYMKNKKTWDNLRDLISKW